MRGNVHQVHNEVNPVCASPGMEAAAGRVHHMHMARVQRKKPKTDPQPAQRWQKTYLREWREKAGLSLETASAEMGLKHSQLSRIERGKQQYNQRVLEVAERLYSTSIWAILYLPPDRPPKDAIAAFMAAVHGVHDLS